MKTIIRVGMSTCGLAAGAQATYTALEQAVRARDLPVSLQRTGCVGATFHRGAHHDVSPFGIPGAFASTPATAASATCAASIASISGAARVEG